MVVVVVLFGVSRWLVRWCWCVETDEVMEEIIIFNISC